MRKPIAALWEPVDFPFVSHCPPPNPFLVRFEATVVGPDGRRFNLPGFFDGSRTWKIRVAPTAEGPWSIRTSSDDPALNGHSVSFTALADPPPHVHGRLCIDPDNPYHFVFEDGSRYFLLGYECDWLWALDMGSPQTPRLDSFLDKLAAHGFNHIILNVYAHDTPWAPGKTRPDDYGPPPMFPWGGSNDTPDHSRFNLAFWHHYDRVVAALYKRGIIAHVMIKVYNKAVSWPAPGSREDDLYFRWLVARYAAFPNIVWDFSKEAQNERDMDYKLGRLRFLRAHDPYNHLITVHDDSKLYDAGSYDELVDFRTDQQHANWHETILRQRQMRRWPVVNAEFGYEHGPGGPEDVTYPVAQSPEELVRRAWEITTAGGYPVYYYTYTAWDIIRPDDTPPGYAYFGNLRAFFEQTRYWLMRPADDLVTAGRCLANPGREYVVYLDRGGETTIILEGDGPFSARWFHCLAGEWRDAGDVTPGRAVRLVPPAEWSGAPVAFHAQAKPRPPSVYATARR